MPDVAPNPTPQDDALIRVAQVVDSLNAGGAERVAVNLANGLNGLGYESHVVVSRYRGTLADQLQKEVKLFCAGRRSRWDLRGMRRMAEYIDHERIDIVHSHNHTSSYLTRLVRRLATHHTIHVVHDHHGRAIGNRRMAFYDRLMLRRVDAYISVSDVLRDRAARLLGLRPDRCLQMVNGIDIPTPGPPWKGRPTVIQVANIRAPKGHSTAVRAAAKLRKKIPDLAWICVGDFPAESAPYLQEVKTLMQSLEIVDCVQLAGPSSDVNACLRKAHVGVLTSDAEGLPMTLLEYMAGQLPVVVTDVGQCGRIVREAQAGIVVPPGDSEGIADAVAQVLSDPEQASAMGRNGRAHVTRYYSVDAMAGLTAALYTNLLAHQGRRCEGADGNAR